MGFTRILLESGSTLTINFLKKNLVDDFKLFVSKNELGSEGKDNIKKNLKILLKNKINKIEEINLFGDKLITYKLK